MNFKDDADNALVNAFEEADVTAVSEPVPRFVEESTMAV